MFFIGQLGVNNALSQGVLVFFIYPSHRGWYFQITFADIKFRLTGNRQ